MGANHLSGGMTRAQLARTVEILAEAAVGARVQKVRQHRADGVIVECRAPGESLYLLFSVHSRFPRFLPLREKPDQPSDLSAFGGLLRKRLIGGRVVELTVVRADRIVTLSVNKRDDEGGEGVWTLVAELFGAKGNLWLLDPDGKVVSALLPKRAKTRSAMIGNFYEPLPAPSSEKEMAVDDSFDPSALAVEFIEAERQADFSEQRKRLRSAVMRELRRTRKYLGRIEQEREDLADAEALTRQAQALLAYLTQVKKGQATVTLADPAEPDGEPLTIELDPAKSPQENANAMFKQAGRARRKKENLSARIEEMQTRVATLNELVGRLDAAEDDTALDEVAEQMATEKVGPKRKPKVRVSKTPAKKKRETGGPRPFVAEDGALIYVGRNDKENEHLTFRVARGNDYWLHVEGAPGSHVVVRLPSSGELSGETLLDAATLAVLHSSLKNSRAGTVQYTRRKHVRKPKGAAPGKVLAGSVKSIHVKLDDQRLSRLYDSRED